METCRELLPILKTYEKNKFQRSVTQDERDSLWNFIILRNGEYREMMSIKR
jgi:hypothetical protein